MERAILARRRLEEKLEANRAHVANTNHTILHAQFEVKSQQKIIEKQFLTAIETANKNSSLMLQERRKKLQQLYDSEREMYEAELRALVESPAQVAAR